MVDAVASILTNEEKEERKRKKGKAWGFKLKPHQKKSPNSFPIDMEQRVNVWSYAQIISIHAFSHPEMRHLFDHRQ